MSLFVMKGARQLYSDGQVGQSVSGGHYGVSERVLPHASLVGAQVRPALSQPEPEQELFRQLRRLSALLESSRRRARRLRVLQVGQQGPLSRSVAREVPGAARRRRFPRRYLRNQFNSSSNFFSVSLRFFFQLHTIINVIINTILKLQYFTFSLLRYKKNNCSFLFKYSTKQQLLVWDYIML